jgi:superfamily I DNA and/or RNA helicase
MIRLLKVPSLSLVYFRDAESRSLRIQVHWEVPQPILVSAYTNNAVDNLAEGMSKRGLKVLRYGSRSRIRDDLEKLTLDWYLSRHPKKDELQKLKALTYNLPKGKSVRRLSGTCSVYLDSASCSALLR